jgi:hypothetical protein
VGCGWRGTWQSLRPVLLRRDGTERKKVGCWLAAHSKQASLVLGSGLQTPIPAPSSDNMKLLAAVTAPSFLRARSAQACYACPGMFAGLSMDPTARCLIQRAALCLRSLRRCGPSEQNWVGGEEQHVIPWQAEELAQGTLIESFVGGGIAACTQSKQARALLCWQMAAVRAWGQPQYILTTCTHEG